MDIVSLVAKIGRGLFYNAMINLNERHEGLFLSLKGGVYMHHQDVAPFCTLSHLPWGRLSHVGDQSMNK